ncbi:MULTISPECIES: hypothetical protein [Sorangium]|uniref:hypothetical protein n=1 Tax=Sorangium TaxID=39643 RepID=UPI003D9C5804
MRSIAVGGLALAGATAIGALLIGGPGCSDTASSVCAELCDCWQCSGAEYEECLDSMDDTVQSAERRGCPEAADGLARCVSADLKCAADRDAAEPTSCEREQQALAVCGVRVPVLGPLCERGAQRHWECRGAELGADACEGASRCRLACYADASCDEVRSDSSRRLADCFQRCAEHEPTR